MAPLSTGIGELEVSNNSDDVITALGLGSCVAIILYDPSTGTVGMLHAMLPTSTGQQDPSKPARNVEEGLPRLLEAMRKAGARRQALCAALVGGAAMFEFTGPSMLEIGSRNIDVARKMLKDYHIPLLASDVGGNRGRTVLVKVANATVTVRMEGNQKELVCLSCKAALKRAA